MEAEAASEWRKVAAAPGFWDQITEYEIDGSWRAHCSPEYLVYRERFEKAQRREYLAPFPLSIEIEASYHCNLKCPFCPRVVNIGERQLGHMSRELWEKIIKECQENGLPSLLMDHEAESLMNPRFLDMVRDAKRAGVLDIWLHTNANLLTPEKSALLIDAGLTKINFSVDAQTEETYKILRVGGNFKKVIENIKGFLRIRDEKKATGIRTRISFVEQKENLREKKPFFDFWKREKGLNLIAFQECIDFRPFEKPDEDGGLSEEELEKKYASDEPFHCTMPWEMPVIDTQGNVIPCGAPVREHNREFVLGNLNQGDTIKSCWNSDKMNALRALHDRGEWYKNPMCRVCVKTLRSSRKNLMAWRQEASRPLSSPGGEECNTVA